MQRVAYSEEDGHVDLWILLDREILPDAERIYLAERDLRQRVGAFPFRIHVIPLDEVEERHLPPSETIIGR